MDKLKAMAVFVRVVESGSFSAVAREQGITQPTVSKFIQALETELGGRLFARSTRHLSLSDEGLRYYRACREILAAVDVAEHRFVSGKEQVAGPLRIAAPGSFGRLQLAPRLADFLSIYPEVTVDLVLSDQNQDLLAEGIDLAFRVGALRDSGLVARPVGLARRAVLAAPAYLNRTGRPNQPEDLRAHNCLVFTGLADPGVWRFRKNGALTEVTVSGKVRSNQSEAIRELVLAGYGIALSPLWLFSADLAAGRVESLLSDHDVDALPINAIFPENRRQSARVRAFVEFMAAAFDQDPAISREPG